MERKDAKGEQLDDEADVRRETQRHRETERATSNDERREFAQGEWVGGWRLTTHNMAAHSAPRKEGVAVCDDERGRKLHRICIVHLY